MYELTGTDRRELVGNVWRGSGRCETGGSGRGFRQSLTIAVHFERITCASRTCKCKIIFRNLESVIWQFFVPFACPTVAVWHQKHAHGDILPVCRIGAKTDITVSINALHPIRLQIQSAFAHFRTLYARYDIIPISPKFHTVSEIRHNSILKIIVSIRIRTSTRRS